MMILEQSNARLESTCSVDAIKKAQHLMEEVGKIQPGFTRNVERISWSGVNLHEKIGSGSYCNVHSARVALASGKKQETVAIKTLKRKVSLEATDRPNQAITDLACEGALLESLHHPNIIEMRAAASSHGEDYFLALELLEETLKDRLVRWRDESPVPGRRQSLANLLSFSRGSIKSDMYDRVKSVAVPVAKALNYLHVHNIVMRDLKPDNIGFDFNGNVKLFDFGFARELHQCKRGEIAGTLRYMAPEICEGKTITEAVDVYSFGVLLFELCSLDKPFASFNSVHSFKENVVKSGYRPSLRVIPSKTIRRLIAACWSADPKKRPSMAQALSLLKKWVSKMDWCNELYNETTAENEDVPAVLPLRRLKSLGCESVATVGEAEMLSF